MRPTPVMGVYRKRRNNSGGFARKFMKAGAAGLRLAMRFRNKGSGSRTTRAGRSNDYGNITFQNDEHVMYRRKRAPKRVRRAHRKAFRNFMYNLDKVQSMKTCLITGGGAGTLVPTSNSNSQLVFGVTLYGYGGNAYATNTNKGNGDIPFIFARENGAYPTINDASRKLRFRSATLNLTIYNALVGNEENAFGGILNLDVYHVLCRKTGTSGTAGGDPALWWSDAISEQAAGNMPFAVVTNQYEGVTPFDAPSFCSNFIIKRVRKIRLSPGQTFQTQLRDPGNYVLSMYDVLDRNIANNLTEGYIVVGYNPAMNPGSGVRGVVAYNHNYSKKYHYTETSSSVDAIGSAANNAL